MNAALSAIDSRPFRHTVCVGVRQTKKEWKLLLGWYRNCMHPVSGRASEKKVGTEAEEARRKVLSQMRRITVEYPLSIVW